jgi:hypothetical protein
VLLKDAITRAPCLRLPSAMRAAAVKRWVESPDNYLKVEVSLFGSWQHALMHYNLLCGHLTYRDKAILPPCLLPSPHYHPLPFRILTPINSQLVCLSPSLSHIYTTTTPSFLTLTLTSHPPLSPVVGSIQLHHKLRPSQQCRRHYRRQERVP